MGLQMGELGPSWINKSAAGEELIEKKEGGRKKGIPQDKLTSVK